MPGPLICDVTRGTMTESRHRVHAMIVGPDGATSTWGDPALLLYPRSAIKFIQTIPLIETGAADALGLSSEELALASASHSGDAEHVSGVSEWLDRMGLGPDDLGCGAHLPYDDDAAHDLIRARRPPSRLHNNCSGKHAGLLATAKHLGEPLADYLRPEHPVQRRLYDLLVDFGGEDLSDTGRGIDGCGIPVYGMTLRALARAAQRLAAPARMTRARADAVTRILGAVMSHPHLVGGRRRFDTDVMRALRGTVATKGGAEGVHIAAVPSLEVGVALKVEDGGKRAADAAMAWLLDHLGLMNGPQRRALDPHLRPTLRNAAGDHVGTILVAAPD